MKSTETLSKLPILIQYKTLFDTNVVNCDTLLGFIDELDEKPSYLELMTIHNNMDIIVPILKDQNRLEKLPLRHLALLYDYHKVPTPKCFEDIVGTRQYYPYSIIYTFREWFERCGNNAGARVPPDIFRSEVIREFRKDFSEFMEDE